jgi:hypothetical protein
MVELAKLCTNSENLKGQSWGVNPGSNYGQNFLIDPLKGLPHEIGGGLLMVLLD